MATTAHSIDELMSMGRSKAFLGREFLTWLWYLAETMQERLRVEVAGRPLEIDLWVDDRLVLEGSAAMSHQNVMKGGDPSHSQEASASLSTGKTVREMKLGIRIKDGGDFSAVLNCEDLNPRSLKLPTPEPQEGQDGEMKAVAMPLVDRLNAATTFAGILDALFSRFRAARVEADWDKTVLKDMREWIKRRQKVKDSDILH
mgnify:CR=1 FL=1